MDLTNLSTSEKILLVEEIWDSIAEDTLALSQQHKKLLDERMATFQNTTKRTTWDKIKNNVRVKKANELLH